MGKILTYEAATTESISERTAAVASPTKQFLGCNGLETVKYSDWPDQNSSQYLDQFNNPQKAIWIKPHTFLFNHILSRKFFNTIYWEAKADFPAFSFCHIDLTVTYKGVTHTWLDTFNWPGNCFNVPVEIDKVFHMPSGKYTFPLGDFRFIQRETGANVGDYPVEHAVVTLDFTGLNL